MTIIPVKRKSKSGKIYYNLIDEKRVNGKVIRGMRRSTTY